MNVSEKAQDKITGYIIDYNSKNIHQQFPKSGHSFVESNFKLSINEKSDKYAFVVSEKISFYNGSMQDRRYQIKSFDIITGGLAPDFEKNGGCYCGFFNDLKIVKDIL